MLRRWFWASPDSMGASHTESIKKFVIFEAFGRVQSGSNRIA
jgi:hypothetical protein